ncbi:MAG: hypothetical protein KF861_03385 [Planctomycetaceae bacterium]|nr:hypothetical protein [Planctomycetaceae bacterium]
MTVVHDSPGRSRSTPRQLVAGLILLLGVATVLNFVFNCISRIGRLMERDLRQDLVVLLIARDSFIAVSICAGTVLLAALVCKSHRFRRLALAVLLISGMSSLGSELVLARQRTKIRENLDHLQRALEGAELQNDN